MTKPSLCISSWMWYLLTHRKSFGKDEVLPLLSHLKMINKPMVADEMDAHSFFMAVARDYLDSETANQVTAGNLSTDDADVMSHALDSFFLPSSRDPKYHQRIDYPKLICGRGVRPIFTRPEQTSPAANDLYLQSRKNLHDCLSTIELGESMLGFFQSKARTAQKAKRGALQLEGGTLSKGDARMAIAGVLKGFYNRAPLGGAKLSDLPKKMDASGNVVGLKHKLIQARDSIIEHAVSKLAEEAGEDPGGSAAGDPGSSAAGDPGSSAAASSMPYSQVGTLAEDVFNGNPGRGSGVALVECFMPRSGPLRVFTGHEEDAGSIEMHDCPSSDWYMLPATPLIASVFSSLTVGVTTPQLKMWARSQGPRISIDDPRPLSEQFETRAAFGKLSPGEARTRFADLPELDRAVVDALMKLANNVPFTGHSSYDPGSRLPQAVKKQKTASSQLLGPPM